MKVVLKQDVKSIGKKDELHEVSGRLRPQLSAAPRALPWPPTPQAVNEVKDKSGRPASIMQRRSWPTRRRWPKS